jgi:hypothetical protein
VCVDAQKGEGNKTKHECCDNRPQGKEQHKIGSYVVDARGTGSSGHLTGTNVADADGGRHEQELSQQARELLAPVELLQGDEDTSISLWANAQQSGLHEQVSSKRDGNRSRRAMRKCKKQDRVQEGTQ